MYEFLAKETFCNDTGTSCTGLYDVEKIDENVGGVVNQSIYIIFKGKADYLVTQSDTITLEFVGVQIKVCSAATVELFVTMTEADQIGSSMWQNTVTENFELRHPDRKTVIFN